jgi:hypothetical protein
MPIPKQKQTGQDWLTQLWVIRFGKQIDKETFSWLLGPFGSTKGIGKTFIHELAEKEHLYIDQTNASKGLLPSIHALDLSSDELNNLASQVKDFYEHTSSYDLDLNVKWNPFFKVFAVLITFLFSKRIQQLNIPTANTKGSKALDSEIIHLRHTETNEVKRIIWFRTFVKSKQVVYSGVYGIGQLPAGKKCIKAVFPLPNGNATVLLTPSIGPNGELILESSGKKIGDSGFYFLVADSKGSVWTKFIKSFKDTLIVGSKGDELYAVQTLRLWNRNVVRFDYTIKKKDTLTGIQI